ncbi:complement C1q and tumor necrosis factor-related protein 9-like [Ruditapes philippinarum]|uniref:complement C1q and tumor necrosis factor-related protein 9-like n=1 Tax=Ruditapes philippinarum TaxID=129788 RepID=UPI00295A6B2A|nr:complement C1q and tumor necrosis factor-related protein 9-like [Ruditapes philippinarum]
MIITLFAVLGLFASFVNCSIDIEDLEDVFACSVKNKRIAFEAHMESGYGFIPLNKPLIFPVCTLNEGNGYDVKSGKFTAPRAGVYTFNAHLCHAGGKYMVFAITKGGVQLAVSTSYENMASGCGSLNTIVRLKSGEVVNVVAKWTDSHLFADLHRWISFTGYFVYA